jgi:hypothetical protein
VSPLNVTENGDAPDRGPTVWTTWPLASVRVKVADDTEGSVVEPATSAEVGVAARVGPQA